MNAWLARARAGAAARAVRRSAAAASLGVFCKVYFPERFHLPFGLCHKDACAELESISTQRGCRLVIVFPPEHGKSTLLARGHALWALATAREPEVVIVCRDAARVEETLDDCARMLAGNTRLMRDYPGAALVRSRGRELRMRWGGRLRCILPGEPARATDSLSPGPSLLILDDADAKPVQLFPSYDPYEIQEGMDLATFRAWFERTEHRLPRGANVVLCGSILGTETLLHHAADTRTPGGWRRLVSLAVRDTHRHVQLHHRWIGIFGGKERFEGGTGPAAAARFFAQHAKEISETTEVAWPAKHTVRELWETIERLRQGQRGKRLFWEWTAYVPRHAERREREPWRAVHPKLIVLDGEHDEVRRDGQYEYRWGIDPRLAEPDRDESVPEFACVRIDLSTGVREALEVADCDWVLNDYPGFRQRMLELLREHGARHAASRT